MWPSELARVRRSASSGETKSVITGVFWASPDAVRSSVWPEAMTATFCRTVVVCCSVLPAGVPVSRTSTRVPGPTNPATETTSFTRTDTARMPGGIKEGKPDPAFSPASLPDRRNSPLAMGRITPWSRTSAFRRGAVGGTSEAGILMILMSCSSTLAPTCRSSAATITSTPGSIGPPLFDIKFRYTMTLTNAPSARATTPIISRRVRFIASLKNGKRETGRRQHRHCEATHRSLRLRQQDLLNRTGDLGKSIVRVGANQPYRTHHDHQNHGEHHGVFGDILPFFVTTKPPQKFHTLRASFRRSLS